MRTLRTFGLRGWVVDEEKANNRNRGTRGETPRPVSYPPMTRLCWLINSANRIRLAKTIRLISGPFIHSPRVRPENDLLGSFGKRLAQSIGRKDGA